MKLRCFCYIDGLWRMGIMATANASKKRPPADAKPIAGPSDRLLSSCTWLLSALAIVSILLCATVCLIRLFYPYEFEWCEGAMVDAVRRIIDGKPLYTVPTIEFTCWQYSPLYFWVSAAVSVAFGINFFSLRLVSVLATLGTLACIGYSGWKETGRRAWGLMAAGLYAATLGISSGWFPLARVDSLALCLFLAALCLMRYGRQTVVFAALAGVLLFLSIFTKQNALIMAAPVMVYFCMTDWRRGLVFSATATGLTGLATLVYQHLSDGWFLYYTVTMLMKHPKNEALWMGFWMDDLRPLWMALGLSAVAIFIYGTKGKSGVFWVVLAAGIFGGVWRSRLHQGSSVNSDLPVFALLAILSVLAAHELISRAARRRVPVALLLTMALVGQFALLAYNPSDFIPSCADREANRVLYSLVRELDGEVYMPFHGNLSGLAGKTSYAHGVSIWDVCRADNPRLKEAIRAELETVLRNGMFSVIILNEEFDGTFTRFIGWRYKKLDVPLFKRFEQFRPIYVYCRKDCERNLELLKAALPIAN